MKRGREKESELARNVTARGFRGALKGQKRAKNSQNLIEPALSEAPPFPWRWRMHTLAVAVAVQTHRYTEDLRHVPSTYGTDRQTDRRG